MHTLQQPYCTGGAAYPLHLKHAATVNSHVLQVRAHAAAPGYQGPRRANAALRLPFAGRLPAQLMRAAPGASGRRALPPYGTRVHAWLGGQYQTFQTEQAMLARYSQLLKESTLMATLNRSSRLLRRCKRCHPKISPDWQLAEPVQTGAQRCPALDTQRSQPQHAMSWDQQQAAQQAEQQRLDYGHYAYEPNNITDLEGYMPQGGGAVAAAGAAEWDGYLGAQAGAAGDWALRTALQCPALQGLQPAVLACEDSAGGICGACNACFDGACASYASVAGFYSRQLAEVAEPRPEVPCRISRCTCGSFAQFNHQKNHFSINSQQARAVQTECEQALGTGEPLPNKGPAAHPRHDSEDCRMKPRMSVAVLACLCTSLLSFNAVVGSSVRVSTGQELVQAMQDTSVEHISVDRPIRLENADFPEQIIKLNRNLTISSPKEGPHQVIDFNARLVTNKLSIGAGFNLSLVHLTIKDTRFGPGADVDVLGSSPNSILYLHDLAKVQSSCPPLNEPQILAYQRDPTVPGTNVITFPGSVAWDGIPYNYSIRYLDFSTRMSVGENADDRGYVVHKRDSWKLCTRVVDPACVAHADTASCIKQEMEAMDLALYPEAQRSELSTGATAGIAVAAVAGGALLAAAAALLVVRRRRRQAAAAAALLPVQMKPGAVELSGDSRSDGGHGSYNKLDGVTPHSTRRTSHESVGAPSLKTGGMLAVGSRSSLSMPSILKGTLTARQAAELQLGSLIGAGSFGRVFLGCVGGREVAIKVVHHDTRSAPQVASEVELMMKFDHPNLIKAYEYVTWGSAGVSVRLTRPLRAVILLPSKISAFRKHWAVVVSSGGDSGNGNGVIVGGSGAASGPQRMLETWIICELANAGNLQDAGMVLSTLSGVAKGMQWLHAHNVLHGDLKAANVMLSIVATGGGSSEAKEGQADDSKQQADDGDDGAKHELLAKVADFGLSRMMCEGATHLSTHTVGTITHQPPELMRSGRLSKPADVFSFGVMMWEVIMAAHPWKGMMMGEIMNKVMVEGQRLKFGAMVPKAYAAVAEQCWQEDPADRPTFAQLLAQLQQLQQQEEALQDEVEEAYRGVVGAWETGGSDAVAAGKEEQQL
ncbi:hypothetical protein COO60DRAFT_1626631 [Scenedesmus sp. NREL 46B-D3]|nr:hypothetical protein COO60DRAFT_1626631 [Scenedesmus sp. NREL 46B-D3]